MVLSYPICGRFLFWCIILYHLCIISESEMIHFGACIILYHAVSSCIIVDTCIMYVSCMYHLPSKLTEMIQI